MKLYLKIVLLLFCSNIIAQNNRGLEIPNSPFVVVKYHEIVKGSDAHSGLKFIDTQTGKSVDIMFDKHTSIKTLELLKLDAHGLNAILVITQKVQKKNSVVDFESAIQLYSGEGKLINKATLDQHISDYVINNTTGKIVLIMGGNHYKASSKDIGPKEVVLDLKTLIKI